MGLVAGAAGATSKVLARLHRWYATAWLLAQLPLEALDSTSSGRLRYALMMAHRTRPSESARLFERILRRYAGTTPELQIELAAMATVTDKPSTANRLLLVASERVASDADMADAGKKLLSINVGIADGSLRSSLSAQIDALHLPVAEQVTLVPVSGKYLELWHLWLAQVRKHVGRHVIAMALDDAAYTALAGEADVAVVDVREFFSWDQTGRLHPHTRGVLWYLRVLLLRDLVQRGHPVLVLDLDAMPVGDVQAMLSDLPDADVIAQKDHSIPMDVDRQLGFVLCCGFMLWRPTAAAQEFLEHFVRATAIERDDQLALNHLLAQRGIVQDADTGAGMRFESAGAHFACPPETLVSRSLEHGSVVRHFHQTGKSVPELRDALGL